VTFNGREQRVNKSGAKRDKKTTKTKKQKERERKGREREREREASIASSSFGAIKASDEYKGRTSH
jgi:hypothetical protein